MLVRFFFKIYLLSLYSNLGKMREVDDIPCPQNLIEIVEILAKFRRPPPFLLFSLAAFYAAFKFLILFLQCATVFSEPCLFTSALTFCHTVAHFGVSSKKKFSFQSFTRASVCFADQRSLFVFDWITFISAVLVEVLVSFCWYSFTVIACLWYAKYFWKDIGTSLYSLVKLSTYLKYSP